MENQSEPTPEQYAVLLQLAKSFAFDPRDNTLSKTKVRCKRSGTDRTTYTKPVTLTAIAKELGLSRRKFGRVLDELEAIDAIRRDILDIYEVPRIMVNPEIICAQADAEMPLVVAMYTLGSHEAGAIYTATCRERLHTFDPDTGEVLEDLPIGAVRVYDAWMRYNPDPTLKASSKKALPADETEEEVPEPTSPSKIDSMDIGDMTPFRDGLKAYH